MNCICEENGSRRRREMRIVAVDGPVVEVLVLQLLYAITAGKLINVRILNCFSMMML